MILFIGVAIKELERHAYSVGWRRHDLAALQLEEVNGYVGVRLHYSDEGVTDLALGNAWTQADNIRKLGYGHGPRLFMVQE
jgi:hypothetical protein